MGNTILKLSVSTNIYKGYLCTLGRDPNARTVPMQINRQIKYTIYLCLLLRKAHFCTDE